MTLKSIQNILERSNKKYIKQSIKELERNLNNQIKNDLKQELVVVADKLIRKNKSILRKTNLSYESGKFITSDFTKPYYAYTAYHAMKLASKLGHKKVSLIEFGVAGGRGLVCLERVCEQLEKIFNIEIEIYGFDLGSGLFSPKSQLDLKYWFQAGQYEMDENHLKKQLTKSKLIIGDVKDTVVTFFEKYQPAPIACIMHDLDYYSSTIDSFKLLSAEIKYFLPRVYCYFDDTVGTEIEMYNEYTGQLKAIRDFNEINKDKKFSQNRNLVNYNDKWRKKIYHLHLFSHPDYDKFIGESEQQNMIKKLNELNK